MNEVIRPLAEVNRQATKILIRVLGVVDAHRFLSQFRSGSGNYTKERDQWFDDLSLEQIVSEIKGKRRKSRRTKR
jgi:hypothetical protein